MKTSVSLAVMMALVVPGVAFAGPMNLVQNGDFETTTMTTPSQMNTTNVANWSTGTGADTSAYNFIFGGTTAGTLGSYTPEYNANIKLWGAQTTGPALGASPTGGNFVGADGAFQVAPITQTIMGLVAGDQYSLTFYWAGAQQSGFTGNTTEQWVVSFGGQTQHTPVVNNLSHGFTGWMEQNFTFTANGSSDVLSFLAVGTPNGEPPFALLDGVSLVQDVSEPATAGVVVAAMLGLGFVRMRRRGVAADAV
jgi:hypothetical protein